MADIPDKTRPADRRLRRARAATDEGAGAAGLALVLTDIVPFPDAVPGNGSFVRADLNDGMAILRLAEGCGMILHFGGVSTEKPFEEVLGANIRGLYHIYEAARREKRARAVRFVQSQHRLP